MGTNDVINGNSLIEPDDSIEVQMISGLIQHQQRGLHEQCPKGWAAEHRVREILTQRTPEKPETMNTPFPISP